MAKTKSVKPNRQALLPYVAVSLVALVFGVLCCVYGFRTVKHLTLKFIDTASTVDYQVCNYTHQSPILEGKCSRQQVYVASLIESVPTSFNYVAEFSPVPVSGELRYRVSATVTAKQASGQNRREFGKKTFYLTEEKVLSVFNQRSIAFEEKQNIIYPEYNAVLKEFQKISPGATGDLKVALVVTGEFTAPDFPDPVRVNSEISISLPLVARDVDVSAVVRDDAAPQVFTAHVNIDDGFRFCGRLFGVLFCLVFLFGAYLAFLKRAEIRADFLYDDAVAKIHANYDGIIADIRSAPNLHGVRVSEVGDFDELLDVYNAVHLPINFYQTADRSFFIIVGEKMAWRFTVTATAYKTKITARKERLKRWLLLPRRLPLEKSVSKSVSKAKLKLKDQFKDKFKDKFKGKFKLKFKSRRKTKSAQARRVSNKGTHGKKDQTQNQNRP